MTTIPWRSLPENASLIAVRHINPCRDSRHIVLRTALPIPSQFPVPVPFTQPRAAPLCMYAEPLHVANARIPHATAASRPRSALHTSRAAKPARVSVARCYGQGGVRAPAPAREGSSEPSAHAGLAPPVRAAAVMESANVVDTAKFGELGFRRDFGLHFKFTTLQPLGSGQYGVVRPWHRHACTAASPDVRHRAP